ncbi:shikimate kinase [Cellulomonas hominis]|uniref:shikimate kinase n=1 Tax=Cellulomonas hominis TaxID=156981 RepID=UPI001443EF2E|nr:shikimate kinase [Cellulomonas hominis]NKY10360.1 shikimate kinase [Cellulomonas hominis]
MTASTGGPVVLVGPAAAGKSTAGALAAAALGAPFVDLDAVGGAYYREVGWSVDRLVVRARAAGRIAAEREWEPARAHAVERVVADHPRAVIALGAGHASYTQPDLRARVQRALAPAADVVLLLPSPDRDGSLAVLRERALRTKGTGWVVDGHDLLAEWLDDEGLRALARRTVHTDGRTPEETARAVLRG